MIQEIVLSKEEKNKCLIEILKKLKKILYVYEKSQEPNSTYNYKDFCKNIILYIQSSNSLLDNELTDVIVNINTIIIYNLSKKQIKRIVFESINKINYLLKREQI